MEDTTGLYASTIVEKFSEDYAHENFKSFFPSMVDGLKCVYRRTIHAFQKAGIADGTVVKSTRAVAEVSANHPTGDASMYDVIMKMSQPWVMNPTLTDCPSNNGSYGGNNPGAQRYTSIKLSHYAKEMFLDGIDLTALPKVEGPFLELEPTYFIPALPTALLIDNLTIGYAISCLTARLNFSNVCDLVKAYVSHQLKNPYKLWDYAAHAEKFLPDFPTNCIITNAEELVENYRVGNFNHPIEMDGRVTITKDKIWVRSLPHGIPFRSAIENFENHLKENPNGEVKKLIRHYNFTRSKKLEGDLTILPKTGVSSLYLWRLIAPIIRFSSRYHPNPNYTLKDQITVEKVSYLDILRVWYKEREMIVVASKRKRLQKLHKDRQILEAQIIAVKHPDRVHEILKGSKTTEDAIQTFLQEFDLTPFQSKSLMSLKFQTLIQTSMKKLEEEREATLKAIEDLTESFSKIGEEIIERAQYFKKKYGSSGRISHIPEYKGYVKFEDGIVLYENVQEVDTILEDFPKEKCEVISFTTPHQIVIGENGKEVKSKMHTYMSGDILSLPSFSPHRVYTVSIKDGAACYSPGIKTTNERNGVFYVTKSIIALHRNGQISNMSVTDFSKRNNCLESQGASTNVVHVLSSTNNPFYIASFYTSECNVLRLEKVSKENKKYISNPKGEQFLFVSLTGQGWLITPPKDCVNRFSARLIHIVDAEALLNGKSSLCLDLLSKSKRNSALLYIP